MSTKQTNVEKYASGIALALLILGCLMVLRPFASALLWAVILCFSTWPLYSRVVKFVRGRRTLAALIMAAMMIVVILLPFVMIGATVGNNVSDLTAAARHWMEEGPPKPPEWVAKIPMVGAQVSDYWNNLATDRTKLVEVAKKVIEPVSTGLLVIGKILASGLFELGLSMLIAFFLFRDGEAVGNWSGTVVERLAGERGRLLLTLAGKTVRGVVYGILGTALVQSVMAGVGFVIAGVPGAGVLALLTFFLSLVPIGPPLIWIPASIWLFHSGSTGWGIFMLIWGVGVSSIDNLVKPWLISQGSDMPFLLIFFGVLGGVFMAGFIGAFLGPTLLSVGYSLVTQWAQVKEETSKKAAAT